MKPFAILPLLALAACAHVEPRIVTRDVLVPVATSCVPEGLGPEPSYPDTADALKAARDAAERYLLMAQGRELRIARAAEVEPVIAACR